MLATSIHETLRATPAQTADALAPARLGMLRRAGDAALPPGSHDAPAGLPEASFADALLPFALAMVPLPATLPPAALVSKAFDATPALPQPLTGDSGAPPARAQLHLDPAVAPALSAASAAVPLTPSLAAETPTGGGSPWPTGGSLWPLAGPSLPTPREIDAPEGALERPPLPRDVADREHRALGMTLERPPPEPLARMLHEPPPNLRRALATERREANPTRAAAPSARAGSPESPSLSAHSVERAEASTPALRPTIAASPPAPPSMPRSLLGANDVALADARFELPPAAHVAAELRAARGERGTTDAHHTGPTSLQRGELSRPSAVVPERGAAQLPSIPTTGATQNAASVVAGIMPGGEPTVRHTDVAMPTMPSPLATATSGDELAGMLGQRLIALAVHGEQHARIALHPAELGALDIRVHLRDESVAVSIATQHGHARELIEAGLPRLRELFAEQGLNLSNVDVSDQGGRHAGHAHGGEPVAPPALEPRLAPATPHAGPLAPVRAATRLLDVLA